MVFDILKLMNGNNKNLFLVGLLVVVLGLGGIWSFIKYRSAVNSPVADLGLVTYVNAQGQEWSIPKGEYEFKVSSAERYLHEKNNNAQFCSLDIIASGFTSSICKNVFQ